MAIVYSSVWLAAAERDAPAYPLTPEELLRVWSNFPEWGPGGRYYLPSSRTAAIIGSRCCQEKAMRPNRIDPLNVLIWTLVWASAMSTAALLVMLASAAKNIL